MSLHLARAVAQNLGRAAISRENPARSFSGGVMEIFDIHHHLGSLTGGSLQTEVGWEDRDYANRVRVMQAHGVTMAAILAATGYIQADGIKDTMRSNDAVAAYRKRDPIRFPVAC